MAGGRWCNVVAGACVLFSILLQDHLARADCWYHDVRYQEASEVPTAEPCLNCTCTRGVLLCYLRVCPRLPDPPPPGCILLHRYRLCCPELICTDTSFGENSLEARSGSDTEMEMERDGTILDNACIANGSIYGPGSAMDSSSLCEYCYCLGGKQICVKPKCLLPIDGCTPMYDPSHCCPMHYNCTRTISTTTIGTTTEKHVDGCSIDGTYYPEGGKVLGVGYSVCDNCYCLRGVLRCEPLSCAPPLLGCSPIVKPGECCAASYNCSGTIEIEPEPNYGLFPIVSKEYAQLRTQAHMIQTKSQSKREGVVTVAPMYVTGTGGGENGKHRSTFGTTRQFSGESPKASTTKPVYYRPENEKTVNDVYYATTNPSLNDDKPDYLDLSDVNIFTIVDSLLDGRLYRNLDNDTDDLEALSTTTETNTPTTDFDRTTTDVTLDTTTVLNDAVTLKTVIKTTECNESVWERISSSNNVEFTTVFPVDPNEINKLSEEKTTSEFTLTSTELEESFTTKNTINNPEDDLEQVSSILNISKTKNNNDYDFDYTEPTLPPSLPNLRIIPFVVADALDLKKEILNENIVYKPNNPTEYGFGPNLFSPPIETEGGFVPKEPPILDNFYENAVTSSSKNPEELVVNCNKEGNEIPHGTSITSNNPCETCTCFYGNIVCQKPTCPLPATGCRVSTLLQDVTLCCPNYICDDVSKPLLTDRIDASPPQESTSLIDRISAPDPFNNVIKTEQPPDLQSLMVDMMPFLQRITTTPLPKTTATNYTDTNTTTIANTLQQTTEQSTNETYLNTANNGPFDEDKVLQFLLSTVNNDETIKTNQTEIAATSTDKSTVTPPPPATSVDEKPNITSNITENVVRNLNSTINSVNESVGVGLLKLAGCNIYGRMYRVGRIISELSGPCLVCKCTEVGVQCTPLNC